MTTDVPSTGALRVLVVADEEADAQRLVRELQRAGLDVAWRRADEDGPLREALAIVRAVAGDAPFLVVTPPPAEQALGKTASRITHDLRNLLNPLALDVQVAQRACARGDLASAKEALDEMRALIERGVQTIDTLRERLRSG